MTDERMTAATGRNGSETMDEKVWVYIGKGDFLNGVPARDLYAADLVRLDVFQLGDIERSPLYRRAPQPKAKELEPPAEGQPEPQPEQEPAAVEEHPAPQPEPEAENKTPKGAKSAKEAKE